MENFKDFAELTKRELKNMLYDYIGTPTYAGDLPFLLFESYNADGTFTYSTAESVELIKKYFNDFGEIVERIKEEGLDVINPFDNPKAFVVQMLLEEANKLLFDCETVEELNNEGDEFELTEELAKKIADEL